MKLRQAMKVYNRVNTPRERPWKQNTIAAALRRYQKTDTSRDVDACWDYLMALRRRQLAAEEFKPDYDDNFDDEDGEGDEDYWEEAVQECGLLPEHLGGGCTLGGTEHCDFECPFRDQPHLMTGEDEEQPDAQA